MAKVYNPQRSSISKRQPGISDVVIDTDRGGVFKVLGCSLSSINMTQGFNGSPSSASVSLVEDKQKGDAFTYPGTPTLLALSLPKGGVGKPVVYPEGVNLNPNGFVDSTIPFYFCGIISGWTEDKLSTGAKYINVQIAGINEILSGIQCLLGGFALSQNFGEFGQDEVADGSGRFTDVDNVIDCFGFHDYGMQSDMNEYGMPWNKVKEAIEGARVKLFNINIEFVFNGEAFSTPDWYRVKADIIDLVSLVNKVAKDGGSDVIYYSRKITDNTVVVEIRGIKRKNNDPLTQSEIDGFISDRSDIVESAQIGKEFRNEPTSKIIVGARKNSNYVAWPTVYQESFRADDYSWPASIKARLFGGKYTYYDIDSNEDKEATINMTGFVGGIFPFWGFAPYSQEPLAEPCLFLDHLSFADGDIYSKIPNLKIEKQMIEVRNRDKFEDVFLEGDSDADKRPFYVLSEYRIEASVRQGYIKGLPLNTEILHSSLVSQELFEMIYGIFYPKIAESLGFRIFDSETMQNDIMYYVNEISTSIPETIDFLKTLNLIGDYFIKEQTRSDPSLGKVIKASQDIVVFRNLIFEWVRSYAKEHMGKTFMVMLPKSTIMNRIWDNKPVPVNIDKPQIEYSISDVGYFENLPSEFDGIGESSTVESKEEQIRQKFMTDDGRFHAMAVINWKPSGNANRTSTGVNKIMFSDIHESEYRPNRIAEGNPDRVYVSCNIQSLVKRPDLAIVTLNGTEGIRFDPNDDFSTLTSFNMPNSLSLQEVNHLRYWKFSRGPLIKTFYTFIKHNKRLKETLIDTIGLSDDEISDIIITWADVITSYAKMTTAWGHPPQVCMDLEAVIVPLTSNWVSYGPWYYNTSDAKGMVDVEVDESLVPWNFDRPNSGPWDTNLNRAGQERAERSLSPIDYVDTAQITTAGFPEIGLGDGFGFNSNLTGISVEFSSSKVSSTYSFSLYAKRPGTFRKSDYDQIDDSRRKWRPQLPETQNYNISHIAVPSKLGTNPYKK